MPKSRPSSTSTPATGRQVALLRGINVGRAKRVAMADLRALVERLGFGEVQTLLNSGNVVYAAGRVSPRAAAARIEAAVASELGVRARVFALAAAELDEIVAENPLATVADDPSRLFVCVYAEPAVRSRLALLPAPRRPEAFGVGARAAYLWCPDGLLRSALGETVLSRLGDAVTTRNWRTILKLQALVSAPE
jgi:uncharacterized protein (DUF1697 family)